MSARVRTALLGTGIFLVNALSPSVQVGDSRLSAVTAWQFLTHGNLHLEGYATVSHLAEQHDLVTRHGHLLPYFPWPPMLLAIPADIVAWLSGHGPATMSISDPNATWMVEVPTAALLVALTALALRAIARHLVDTERHPRLPTAAAWIYALTTGAWSVGSRALWQETVGAFLLSVALLAWLRLGGRAIWPWVLGAALALGAVSRPTEAVPAALLLGWLAFRSRPMLLRSLAAAGAVLAGFLAVSLWQYGQLLPPYYFPSRLAGARALPVWNALAMNLVSPSRGLLLYDPIALVAVAACVVAVRRRTFGLLQGYLVATVLAVWLAASDIGSTGGAAYGPRLMLEALPALVVLALPLLAAAAPALRALARPSVLRTCSRATLACALGVGAALAWGGFVNATGALARSGYCWSAVPTPVDSRPSRVWDWGDPQFLRPYRDLAEGVPVGTVVAGSCTTLQRQLTARGRSR